MRVEHRENLAGLHTLAEPHAARQHAAGLRREDLDQTARHIHFTAHHGDVAGLHGMRILRRHLAACERCGHHQHQRGQTRRAAHEESRRLRDAEVALTQPSSMRYSRSA